MPQIKIVIVDDSHTDNYVLLHTLKNNTLFKIIQIFNNGSEFLKHFSQLPAFDCLLINMHLPIMSGLEVASKLKDQNINFKIHITTYAIYPTLISPFIDAGVHAFTRKDPPLLKLIIPFVVAGNLIYEDRAKDLWLVNGKELNMFELEQKTWISILNESEKAILYGFADSLSLHIISRDYDIEIGTLDKYRKKIMFKLKLHSDHELTIWAINNGFGYNGMNREDKQKS